MRFLLKLFVLIPFMLSVIVLGQEIATIPQVPMEDVFKSITDLVQNWSGLKGIGLASAIIAIVFQLSKTSLMFGLMAKAGPFVSRLVITFLGIISGIVMAVHGGMGWIEALIAGLLSSGGAVAMYEAIKPFLNKQNKSEVKSE